ncbi:MAG: AAA family ATPase [Acidobacteria bacterium]|nr:AAA family ATPase [Acidobacteriota bacterium]
MFKRFKFSNYKTHVDSEIDLGSSTLLIGPNSSGKTNLLHAIEYFSGLARKARIEYPLKDVPVRAPLTTAERTVQSSDTQSRYRFAAKSASIRCECLWEDSGSSIDYSIEVFRIGRGQQNLCSENITVRSRDGKESSHETSKATGLFLSTQFVDDEKFPHSHKVLVSNLFRDLGSVYYYCFEPSRLRDSETSKSVASETAYGFNLPRELGRNGGGLHRVMKYIRERDDDLYGRIRHSVGKYHKQFIEYSPDTQNHWTFATQERDDRFADEDVPDGFLRAVAIAILTGMHAPPSLILLEEIENGIDVVRLELMVDWIRRAATSPKRRNQCQFVITSHSPIVLRAFSDDLDHVFQTRLDSSHFQSIVLNLGELLRSDIRRGHVEGHVGPDGKAVIGGDTLVKLWLNRRVGGDTLREDD